MKTPLPTDRLSTPDEQKKVYILLNIIYVVILIAYLALQIFFVHREFQMYATAVYIAYIAWFLSNRQAMSVDIANWYYRRKPL